MESSSKPLKLASRISHRVHGSYQRRALWDITADPITASVDGIERVHCQAVRDKPIPQTKSSSAFFESARVDWQTPTRGSVFHLLPRAASFIASLLIRCLGSRG